METKFSSRLNHIKIMLNEKFIRKFWNSKSYFSELFY